jgi:hypothetical protein
MRPLIPASGADIGGACENGNHRKDYDNQVPLAPFSKWAMEKSYSFQYFDYDLHSPGHSAGADVVIWAAYDYVREGGNASRILGVMALDMAVVRDPSHHYNQKHIEYLSLDNGIPVEVFHSWEYLPGRQPKKYTDVNPDTCIPYWIIRILGYITGFSFHKYLSVDQAGFEKYMKPILEKWRN